MKAETGASRPNNQQWVQEILKEPAKFGGFFVVHTDEDVVFASENFDEADVFLKENQMQYQDRLRLFLVPNNFGQVRLRMLKIKSLSAGEWLPMFSVKFLVPDGRTIELEMLVDSGADVTFLPFKIGQLLGFEKTFGETPLFASGVGSKVPYLFRECTLFIGSAALTVRLLWGQDGFVSDILLGRLDVFDHFDVTFSQFHQKISFDPVQVDG